MFRLWCLLIGYAFGSFQTSYFVGKAKGIDIREHGSGNAGTTNTLRVLGTKAGLTVFVGDMLKAIIAVLICKLIFSPANQEYVPLICAYSGLGCVLGHNFPFYLGFHGGKGIAVTGGTMIAFNWMYIPIGVLLFFGNLFLTHIVSIGSLLLCLCFFVMTIIMGSLGVFAMESFPLYELYVIVFIISFLGFWMHRANIKRLIAGNERKTYLLKKNKMDVETNGDANTRTE